MDKKIILQKKIKGIEIEVKLDDKTYSETETRKLMADFLYVLAEGWFWKPKGVIYDNIHSRRIYARNFCTLSVWLLLFYSLSAWAVAKNQGICRINFAEFVA